MKAFSDFGCGFQVRQQAGMLVLLDAAAEFCLTVFGELLPASAAKRQDLKWGES